jgi:hypothetical protein
MTDRIAASGALTAPRVGWRPASCSFTAHVAGGGSPLTAKPTSRSHPAVPPTSSAARVGRWRRPGSGTSARSIPIGPDPLEGSEHGEVEYALTREELSRSPPPDLPPWLHRGEACGLGWSDVDPGHLNLFDGVVRRQGRTAVKVVTAVRSGFRSITSAPSSAASTAGQPAPGVVAENRHTARAGIPRTTSPLSDSGSP